MNSVFQRFQQLMLVVVLGLFSLIWPLAAQADPGAFLSSSSYAELQSSLEQTRDPQRLADLQALEQAIAASEDRAQVSNQTSHSLGVFARYKKDPAEAPSQFYVLGAGHASDDDYELVAVLVPAQVSLGWGEAGSIASASNPRVLRVLEGEQLTVAEPVAADGAPAAVTYQLSLPAYSVETSLASIADVPALSQDQLDQSVETAPVD